MNAPADTAAARVFTVRVEPAGWVFSAREDEALLAAAMRAGIELPASCRNGTCRACLCQAVAGQVAYAVAWPGVSPDERAEGWVLPCVAQCRSDVVLHQPRAALPSMAP